MCLIIKILICFDLLRGEMRPAGHGFFCEIKISDKQKRMSDRA